MLKGKKLEVNNLEPWEVCAIYKEVVNIILNQNNVENDDFKFDQETFRFKINGFEYCFDSIPHCLELINKYANEYMFDDFCSRKELYLYENMIGWTNNKLFYPGLNSCVGITVIGSDSVKYGAHFVLPIGNIKMQDQYKFNFKCLMDKHNFEGKDAKVYLSGSSKDDIYSHIINLKLGGMADLYKLYVEFKDILHIEVLEDGIRLIGDNLLVDNLPNNGTEYPQETMNAIVYQVIECLDK